MIRDCFFKYCQINNSQQVNSKFDKELFVTDLLPKIATVTNANYDCILKDLD